MTDDFETDWADLRPGRGLEVAEAFAQRVFSFLDGRVRLREFRLWLSVGDYWRIVGFGAGMFEPETVPDRVRAGWIGVTTGGQALGVSTLVPEGRWVATLKTVFHDEIPSELGTKPLP